MSCVAAIVICFYPDGEKLGRLISSVEEVVDEIILFNNGGLDEKRLPVVRAKLRIESRGGQNLGVASALNIACEVAWQDGCRYAVTFDQDSFPEKSMIPLLLAELLEWQGRGQRVAAIGPQLVDVRAGEAKTYPFVRISRFGSRKLTGEGTQPVSLLITSGCLFDLRVWKMEVRFDDRLFIDFADFNWCWRLAGCGYTILGTAKAKLVHELSGGLSDTPWITLTKYGPIRRYFQCRNAIYHFFYEPLSLGGRIFVLKGIVSTMISAAFADEMPRQSLWMCFRGLAHGVSRKLGPYRP